MKQKSGIRLKANKFRERQKFLFVSYLNDFSLIAYFVLISKQYRKYTNEHFRYIFHKPLEFFNPNFSFAAVTELNVLDRVLSCAQRNPLCVRWWRRAGPPASPYSSQPLCHSAQESPSDFSSELLCFIGYGSRFYSGKRTGVRGQMCRVWMDGRHAMVELPHLRS